jgi:hypothetical protein
MIFHRGLARRRGAQRAAGMPGSRAFRVAAVLSLAVLLAGLMLPLTALVLGDGPPPSCCTKGRCCCPADAVSDDRTCVRRGCGCEHRDEAVNGAPLEIEAVLPACAPPATATPAEARWPAAAEAPIARADQPTVPPPRRSLPA